MWEVRIWSKRKKNLISSVTVDPLESRLEAKIAFAGGAVAESQNEKYKDRHNPDECAKLAVECYKDVLKRLEYGLKQQSTAD